MEMDLAAFVVRFTPTDHMDFISRCTSLTRRSMTICSWKLRASAMDKHVYTPARCMRIPLMFYLFEIFSNKWRNSLWCIHCINRNWLTNNDSYGENFRNADIASTQLVMTFRYKLAILGSCSLSRANRAHAIFFCTTSKHLTHSSSTCVVLAKPLAVVDLCLIWDFASWITIGCWCILLGCCKAAKDGSVVLSDWFLSNKNWYSALWLEAAFSLKAV